MQPFLPRSNCLNAPAWRTWPVALGLIFCLGGSAPARNLIGGGSSSGSSAQNGSSSSSATSQTASAATAAAAQAAQAAAIARRAQDSLVQSTTAFQNLQQAQIAAAAAAQANAGNILGTSSQPINGIAVGGLDPVQGIPTTQTSSIQVVDLTGSSKNQLALGNGGSVTLPNGTTGKDQITISGAGSVSTTGGTVTASAGSVVTTAGGTLAATNGGSISLTAGSGTLTSSTSATLTSSLAGTLTLPSGSKMTFSANQAITVPAGSSLTFSGTGTGTVAVNGAGTLTLAGSGTLALANTTAGAGGTITTNSGETSFTSGGTLSSLAAGSTVSLAGSGTIKFAGTGSDVLPVIVQPVSNSDLATPAFTTTGTLLATTGYSLSSLSWTGVDALSQSVNSANSQTTVTITQDAPQALLNWTTFNVGKSTTLDFDQSAGGANVGDWVAINRIIDPSLAPSRILGSINAPGQVYVVNQNGIIFTGSAQVNTHALVASTLPMNSNLIADGLLNNPEGQYLFTSIAIPSVAGSTAYNPNSDPNALPNATSQAITVEEGANLYSPGSVEGVGGKIALIAPTVTNEGELSAPDGQIILAAGQQVGFVAHPSSDASLRGLDVAVGQGAGTVTNGSTGFIYAPEADVTMTGLNVDQMGEIESLTSVTLNGRIDLLAVGNLVADPQNSYIFDGTEGSGAVGGTIDLGPGSLTEILPDYASTATQVGTSLALPSEVYVAGQTFHMESGAQLVAPNATATFSVGILNTPISTSTARTADDTPPLPENTGAAPSNGQEAIPAVYLDSPGQVTLDAGANIDVSGSNNVQASAAENIVSAQLTEAVLENSPLQETGPLRGQTVEVDISLTGTNADGSTWYGSPIGDLSGYANLVEHTVGELTVAGGSVAINTNGAVSMNPTSTINVSGGSIDYQGATVQTTKVITASGQVIDISQATPDQVYQGVDNGFTVSSAKFGTSTTYTSGLQSSSYYDPGYVEGGSGGSLSINASSASLSGSLSGNTTMGARQQSTPPTSSSFSLNIQPLTEGANPPVVDVVIQPSSDSQTASNTTYLSSELFGTDGFANATIDTGSGSITVSADSVIETTAGGSLNLTAANVNVDGQVYIPSGVISITALAKDPLDLSQNNATPYDPTIGNVDVASGAVLSTAGLTFDETSNTTPGTLPFSVKGGSISLSGASTTLAQGSLVDASGGAAREVSGKIVSGKGGSISLSGFFNGTDGKPDGQLVLDGTLSAYGIGQGGSLTLKAPAVQVGGSTGEFSSPASVLALPANFFSQGGFSNFSINGEEGVEILSSVSPVLTQELANSDGRQLEVNQISSADLPQYPAAPVSLTFAAPGSTGLYIGEVTLGAGDAITTGATGSVSLTGQLVDVLGDVTAPGGKITVSGTNTEGLTGGFSGTPDVTVYLGPDASLNTSGVVLTTPTPGEYATYQTGEVLSGGTINLTGNIVAAPGSSLVANGTAGAIDVPYDETTSGLQPSGFARSTPYLLETLGSNGGSITLSGDEELYFGGSVSATPGNAAAVGGTLTVGSGLAATNSTPPNAGFPELFISQSGTFPTGTVTLGSPLSGVPDTGGGFFTVDQFNAGGFGSLILKGNVEFDSSVNITASQEVEIIPDSLNGTVFADPALDAPTIDISAPYIAIGATTLDVAGQSVSAFAPSYVQIGSSSDVIPASPLPGLASPTYGSATLTLNATDLIDVGFLSLQNIGTTNFSVPTGDIRGGGLFYTAGTLNLTAGQIYTPTAASFTIAAFDAGAQPGTINIFAGSARPLPYSAGGTINVYASDINQDGVIEAPFGTINLGALPDLTTGLTPILPGVDFTFNSSTQSYLGEPVYTQYAPVTQELTLGKDSITSVSGVSSTGQALDLPYGTIENGTEWIAPNGANITTGGLPVKAVNVEGVTVTAASGSLVDLAGGGDLFAYQFSPGVGGTNDVLSIYKYADGAVVESSANVPVYSTSFAIVPTYGINYAPVDLTVDSTGSFPYAANPTLASEVGEEVYLAGGDGLAAGSYTILPARYGLLPGAYLVTPNTTGAPTQTTINPDGSAEMGGYVYNSLGGQQIVPQVTGFEVDSSSVINSRAEYDIDTANTFLAASATANNQPVPRLPMDAGQLVFSATQSLNLQPGAGISGNGAAGTDGLGSQVDISSSDNIEINSSGVDASFDGLVLDASELTSLDANSLLIGGYRQSTSSGTVVNVTTDDLVVNNDANSVLEAGDLILVSNGTLNVSAGSSLASSGSVTANNLSVVNSGTGAVGVASSNTGSNVVTLASATLPSSFGVGTSFLGSTVQSINGDVVTLAANADLSVTNQAETFAGNRVTVASSNTGSSTVTLASSTLPGDFGVGSSLLGSTVESISGTTVTLAANANANLSGASETYSSSDGALLRVSGDTAATITRGSGVNSADTSPSLSIASGATISGNSLILDSTGEASLGATLSVEGISISAGRVSVELDNNEVLQPNAGLVISAQELAALQTNTKALALSSYSSIDFYGSGTIGGGANSSGQYPVANFTLDAAAIRGFTTNGGINQGGGDLVINAQNVTLDDIVNGSSTGATVSVLTTSSLTINAGTINFGANNLTLDGFAATNLNASKEMLLNGTGGLATQGGLNLSTPLVTANTGANFAFNAQGGDLDLTPSSSPSTGAATSGGLGATISLTGANVNVGSTVSAPTGTINVQATTGNLEVQATGSLNAGGEAVTFGNVVGYTNGGNVNLTSTSGNTTLDSGSSVNVSALAGGGNAGQVTISAQGTLSVADGSIKGAAGAGGVGGTFDGTFRGQPGQTVLLSGLTTPLTDGGFTSVALDVAGTDSVTVDGAVGAALGKTGLTSFSLTSDGGGITVENTINASGITGGTIDLYADQGVTLTGNANLTVAAAQFNDAGEGGSIDLETRGAGAAGSNEVNIETGATLDLSVASGAGGVLHLRAPTTDGNTNLLIDPIDGTITGASSIVVEGYNVYDTSLTTTAGQNTGAGTGQINSALEGSLTTSTANDGTVYGDAEGFVSNSSAILAGLTNGTPNASQSALFQIIPGAEITNPTGNLTLSSDWDLSSFRFGPNNVAGDLTLRAAGNLVFTGSLTDGFAYNASDPENVSTSPYTWDVLSGPSWSYRIVAGAQFDSDGASTSNFGAVQSLSELGLNTNALTNGALEAGSLLLGQDIPSFFNFGTQTATTAATYAQLIRTGTGSITIDTGGSVDLLNQLATIYTAGELAPTLAGFSSPTGTSDSKFQSKVYGTNIEPAPQYTAQYTEDGGDVTINAQQDIAHLTESNGVLVPDTSWQFPTSWLYRRGATSSTDVFDTTKLNAGEIATTTWWVDFSNFFEGIGALGGGNVTLKAGGNIVNVDAVVPTNARMPYADASGNPLPDLASNLVELGGGDLAVSAGGTIAGGTYYVEKGTGTIEAASITSTGDTARISAQDLSLGDTTPLPLTLYVGDSSFTVSATNDITLGSTVNPFLLPQGIGNNFNNESIFSTYGASSSVSLSSLLGSIEIQGAEIVIQGSTTEDPLPGSLYNAYLSDASPGGLGAGFAEEESLTGTPWTLTLDPTPAGTLFIDNVTDYSTFYELSPPIFNAVAFSGNIQYVSNQLLTPSAQGTLKLLAAGSIDGAFNSPGLGNGLTAAITILDDDPSKLPSIVNPFGLGTSTVDPKNNPSIGTDINNVYALLGETPSYADQSFQVLESYHTSGLLHDNSTTPVEIDTINGDIGDLTLISPEKVDISSGLDLQDVSFYIQNNNANDISVVAADRDITLYDPDSSALVNLGASASTSVAFGDLQISGPGTLEVLAGRNLNLGEGTPPDNDIGTGLGITSIGQSRNPYLPFGGADLITAAGLGESSSLGTSNLTFGNVSLNNGTITPVDPLGYTSTFIGEFLDPSTTQSSRYLPDLGALMNLPSGDSNQQIWTAFASESKEQQDALAQSVFYEVLRDAGRDHNNPNSPYAGAYTEGYAAIASLFPSGDTYQGDISLTSREIKTTNGGDIDMLVPGGGIDVGLNNLGTQAIDQGILTVDGGNISIFAQNDISIGTSRIFTLHGGNIIIWSTLGNIDAGASSRTVQSAPPTRVLVDPQSANVETDLAGLATGGGIGVLETVVGAAPGNVDLIAPVGTVNAGDAGIRSSGNINVAAAQVLNAGNIQASGTSTGVPTTTAPNVSATVAAASAAGSSQSAASQIAQQQQPTQAPTTDLPSIISVEVLGYGGGDDDSAYYSPTSPSAF